jgi:hypothetical protein
VLDGLGADEHGGGDVLVGGAGRGELGHPLLRGRQARQVGAGRHDSAGHLRARPLRPQGSAETLEHPQGFGEMGCRRLFLAQAPLELTDQQLGAGALERHRQPVVLGQCAHGLLLGGDDVTPRRGQHRPAASADRRHPGTALGAAVLFECGRHRLRLVEPAHPDHGLDDVGQVPGVDQLGRRRLLRIEERRVEGLERLPVVPEGFLQETHRHPGPVGHVRRTAVVGR